MDRNEIIRMAREAAPDAPTDRFPEDVLAVFERFAELVRKDYSVTHAQLWLKRFDDAIRAEREACAKIVEQTKWSNWFQADCAAAIRARGN